MKTGFIHEWDSRDIEIILEPEAYNEYVGNSEQLDYQEYLEEKLRG
jgi:hypothetical protein